MTTLQKKTLQPPPLHTVRRRDAPSTENKILNAAEKLFAKHGFDSVSTKQLAAEAGVAIGALYHHFPSKEAVYAAATKRAFAAKSTLPNDVKESKEPPARRLAQIVAWFIRAIIMDKSFGLLIKREMLDPRPSTPHLLDKDMFQQPLNLFKELIHQIAPDANVDEATASMLALVFGFSSLKGIYALFPSVRETLVSPEEIAEHATNLLLRGLRP
ncbi:TetR/AcrR family transcriptional regulator [Ferribacterium limneticum]|uniref:TetR/AcrR family transcriptional regulator n=1 Tax=Ferribacterium limneticum TaxID=76259 RepID=UPI001CF8D181|nr:TetR/AcrR family transcriptional regulator [Ferribacterium limneticum]UCV23645.1 TetR/AcrR family transcriptional regulator [Ferribacterium limneticum]